MEETPLYLDRRLRPQQEWHNDKAQWNKKKFYLFELITLLAGATIPFINVASMIPPVWQRILSALLAVVVVVSVGISKLYKFQETWLNFRAVSESLKREEELYLNEVGDYGVADHQERDRILVERAESILASETSQFISIHKPERKEPTVETLNAKGREEAEDAKGAK